MARWFAQKYCDQISYIKTLLDFGYVRCPYSFKDKEGPWILVTDLFFRVLYLENVVCRVLWPIIYTGNRSSCDLSTWERFLVFCHQYPHTPPKTNMEPEKGPLEKEKHLQTTNCLDSRVDCGVDLMKFYVYVSLILLFGGHKSQGEVLTVLVFRSQESMQKQQESMGEVQSWLVGEIARKFLFFPLWIMILLMVQKSSDHHLVCKKPCK